MPGKVKVKVFGGRNLPVMDRSNDTTDAYVEVKLGNVVFKTDVCRKSLNPEWNSEWFRFEMDDLELQDEPLQIRLMDYDTYSANDSIGRVYIDLNPLLMNPSKTKEPSGRTLSGWIPVYDTMHGIRGEVNLTVKVELFTDLNKFRQSSCGVKFFFTQGIPQGHAAIQLLGFVEELIVNDDPEYQWIDKIRTPRASNEARQMLFSKLSGEVQRRVGLKVLDLGGNAVVGYRQSFDLEGESGIVVRAIGTAATLTKIHEPQISPLPLDLHHKDCVVSTAEPPSTGHAKIQSTSTSCSVEDPCGTGAKERNYSEKENGCDLGHGQVEKANGTNNSINTSSASSMPGSVALSHILESQNNKISLISSNTTKVSVRNAPAVPGAGRRSSESDLSTPPKGLLSTSIQTVLTSAHGKDTNPHSRGPVKDHFDILEYPFITISSLPPRFLHRMGSVVSASSVKVLDRISNLETPESRDSWWTEIRMEVRSHARALSCNVILGYEERTTICDDICILTAIGTAAIVNSATGGEKKDAGDAPANGDAAPNTAKTHLAPVPETRPTKSVKDQKAPSAKPEVFSAVQQNGSKFVPPNVKAPPNDDQELNCSALHIPYGTSLLPFQVKLNRCLICNKGLVPDILIVTVELPPNIPICGKICLIQVQVCRGKKDSKGESGAKEVSDSLPFLEYELHRRLVNKLKVKGLNAIFCLEKQIIIGEKMLVAVATGTAVCLAQLPPPELPKIIAGNSKTDTQKVLQFQKVVQDAFDRNRKSFMVDSSPFAKYHNGLAFPPDVEDEQVEDIPIPPLNLINGNKDVFILEVDDNEDIEIISDIIDSSSMIDTDMNTMDNILEYDDVAVVSQQMFTQVWRCKLPIFNIRMLSGQFEKILRAISYKLRNVRPCVINKLRFHLELPEPDEIQLSVTGTAFGLTMKPKNLVNPSPKTTNSIKEKAGEEPGMIFNLECDGNSNGEDLPRSNSLCTPAPLPLISTNVSSPSSPVQPPIPATSPSIRTATTDNAGSSAVVEKNKTSNEGGFQNPIPAATEPINLNLNASGLTQTGTSNSSTSPRQSQHTPSPHATAHLTSPAVSLRMHGLLPPLSKTVFKSPCSNKGSFIIEMTTLSQIPGYTIDKYLGNLNFFFIRETTSIKEMGGPTGFLHNLIVEVMTVLRAHVAALGGNALVSYFLNELALLHNPHKNQGQCLINIGGDVVFVVPLNQEDQLDSPPPVFQV